MNRIWAGLAGAMSTLLLILTAPGASASAEAQSGRIVILLRPADHVRKAELITDFDEEGSNDRADAAKGTRDLNRDFRFYGLASVQVGVPATVSQVLHPGKYFLIDGGA